MKDRFRDDDGALAPVGDSDAHDKALMVRIAQGDEGALRELIEKHQGAVYGTIAKMLGDPVEAQDLAQQVFVRVYRAAGSYRATAQFKTWMFTIVRNLVFNEHRRRSRATLVSLHPPENEQGHSGVRPAWICPTSANKTPGENMLQQEMLRKIDEAILVCRSSSGWRLFCAGTTNFRMSRLLRFSRQACRQRNRCFFGHGKRCVWPCRIILKRRIMETFLFHQAGKKNAQLNLSSRV